MADPIIVYAALAALAGILWLGVLDKLRFFASFETAVAGYRLLPQWLQKPFALGFIGLELVAATALLVPAWRVVGIVCTLLVLAAATTGVLVNLLRGRTEIDCGCGGLAHESTGISWWLVLRNSVLAVIALLILAGSGAAARELVWLDGVTFFGAALALLGLYLVLNQLITSHLRIQKTRSQA